MTTAALIVAAGRGTRAGAGLPKQWRQLAGQRVADWTVARFRSHPGHAHRMTHAQSSERTRSRRILVVDDDPDFVEATRIVLEKAGHAVVSAANGNESLQVVRKENPDLIILDESFAALDPENFELALDCVLRRAPALVVIAHP